MEAAVLILKQKRSRAKRKTAAGKKKFPFSLKRVAEKKSSGVAKKGNRKSHH